MARSHAQREHQHCLRAQCAVSISSAASNVVSMCWYVRACEQFAVRPGHVTHVVLVKQTRLDGTSACKGRVWAHYASVRGLGRDRAACATARAAQGNMTVEHQCAPSLKSPCRLPPSSFHCSKKCCQLHMGTSFQSFAAPLNASPSGAGTGAQTLLCAGICASMRISRLFGWSPLLQLVCELNCTRTTCARSSVD